MVKKPVLKTRKGHFIKTKNNLTVVIGNKSKVISTTHANFNTVYRLVRNSRWKDAAKYLSLGDIGKQITKAAKKILQKAGIRGKKLEVDVRLAGKALAEMKAGRDPENFKPFFKRCEQNPKPKSVDQLFNFLQHIRAPIQKDGTFLCYKSVRHNFMDHQTGTFDNHPGKEIKMNRKDVTFDPYVTCSTGLHVAGLNYAARAMTRGRLVVVKIDPKDVVSVPHDYNQEKMRVCAYSVVKEIPYP